MRFIYDMRIFFLSSFTQYHQIIIDYSILYQLLDLRVLDNTQFMYVQTKKKKRSHVTTKHEV